MAEKRMSKKQILFKDIKIGEYFVYKDSIYLKTKEIKCGDEYCELYDVSYKNSVQLKNGVHYYFENYDVVEKINILAKIAQKVIAISKYIGKKYG